MSKAAKGRPVGSKSEDRELVDAGLSRCPRCGSTERAKYHNRRRLEGYGVNSRGEEYTAVLLRNTQCLNPDCGQHRVDRFYEFEPNNSPSE